MCKLLQGAGNEVEKDTEAAEEVLEARGSKAAFESPMGAAARVGL
jgi:hypothetical protein